MYEIEIRLRSQHHFQRKQLKLTLTMNLNIKNFNFTFSTGRFPRGDLQHLGWHPHRPLDPQQLILRSLHQIRAYYHHHHNHDKKG